MFLSGASSIVVGSSETYTLNRAALAAELSDAYLKDPAFWKEVLVQFRESGGTQRAVMSFSDSDTAQFVLSPQAKVGTWVLENVAVIDRDNGKELLNGHDLVDQNLYDVTVTNS